MSLPRHLSDAGLVAGRLYDEWLSPSVRRTISNRLPGGEEDARRACVWLALVHDLGKATPAFAVQAEMRHPQLTTAMRAAGLDMPAVLADRHLLRHEVAGQYLLQSWLQGHGWSERAVRPWGCVVGGHHGVPGDLQAVREAPSRPQLLGGGMWTQVQTELLDAAARKAGVLDRLPAWSDVSLGTSAQVLLGALVIVADWVASDASLFPYLDATPPELRLDRAWGSLDLPPPWTPRNVPQTSEELLRSRFVLPDGAKIRPVQEAAVAAARDLAGAGLLVVEAPMGEGKTEAALAAAEILASQTGASGVFVALPSMATSDAIFGRVLSWVGRLPGPGQGDDLDVSVYLAHGRAELNPDVIALRRGVHPTSVSDDEPGVRPRRGNDSAVAVSHQWLRGRKRGVLSSFVVGTIDQVLFAALKSRHLVLRHLALAGKVVIVDECHATDSYMDVYLERALHWLGLHGVPVVLLSATLPSGQRRALLSAYATGAASRQGERFNADEEFAALEGVTQYPVITAMAAGAAPVVLDVPPSGTTHQVELHTLDDDDETLLELLRACLADGGCAGVIRNTVTRAQATAARLAEEFGADVQLFHSRFVATDRAVRERQLAADLGPSGERPGRRIVVGTQVLEQSLDIDFDVLVTDLAPVDLVLQRIGRLHRHQRGPSQSERPRLLQTAQCYLSGADWDSIPPRPVAGSVSVYQHSPLMRAAAVLLPVVRAGALTLPDDIASLVEAGFSADALPPAGWEESWAEAEDQFQRFVDDKRHRARSFLLSVGPQRGGSLNGWVEAGAGDADDSPQGQAQVRDSDPGLEVVVVQRREGEVHLLPWSTDRPGALVPTHSEPGADIARRVASCTLRLPVELTNPSVEGAVIADLNQRYYAAWQTSHWLRGQLVLELDDDLSAEIAGRTLTYSQSHGLRVVAPQRRAQ